MYKATNLHGLRAFYVTEPAIIQQKTFPPVWFHHLVQAFFKNYWVD